MNCWREYVEYLKDNPEGYWFKRKLYGWGWTPAKKEGWITFGVYLAFVLGLVIFSDPAMAEEEVFTRIIGPVVGASILLLAITWRTGEPPKWQWGKKDKEIK